MTMSTLGRLVQTFLPYATYQDPASLLKSAAHVLTNDNNMFRVSNTALSSTLKSPTIPSTSGSLMPGTGHAMRAVVALIGKRFSSDPIKMAETRLEFRARAAERLEYNPYRNTGGTNRKAYEESLIKFIGKFRNGEAELYGYHGIVADLFGSSIYADTMTHAYDGGIPSADKLRIMKKVIRETGFTEAEAERLKSETDARVRERISKDKPKNHSLEEGHDSKVS